MKTYLVSLVVGLVVLGGLMGTGSAAPSYAPTQGFSTEGAAASLVIVCGTPAEFQAVGNVAKAPGQPVSLSQVSGQENVPSSGSPSAVPEPSTMILVGLGLIGIVGLRRWRRNTL
jgi:hypothetical protein